MIPLAWLGGTRIGGWLAAAGAAFTAIFAVWRAGHRSAARDAEIAALRDTLQAKEKADAARAEYRSGGGAADRLRDGRY